MLPQLEVIFKKTFFSFLQDFLIPLSYYFNWLLENPKNNRLLPLLSLEWTYFATCNDKNIPPIKSSSLLKGEEKM